MDRYEEPEELSPEERTREVARLLAVGYLRMRQRHVHPDEQAESTDTTADNDGEFAGREEGEELPSPSRKTLMVR